VGKILIVDDEKFNVDIIEGFLMILGFQNQKELTESAFNGEQSVKIIKKAIDAGEYYKYSLILMDCNMPFMDGYEATKRIRKMFFSMDVPRKQ
jgi:CheY-like chemotaxis protein